ncbi:DUF6166 domain-containing protein [Candidatus Halobonum tyrrellensis]|uniref:Uncharacterized protein n=1 Tax=Candidatus Halobonum tyrrellensis G22 TaxID=1324957 RepID=V4H9Y7_9EURY|nr:DUF6166 domain-containing protein [Candidatus Halobonum tyrrellensis]ESP86848.1 hypothetical protein K933_17232 [Candidatus Halobonum tyrrellensis G22]
MKRNDADTSETNHSSNDPQPDVEYVGFRVDGEAVVLNLTDRRQLSPDRSLDLASHSPTGFEWGFRGNGPAQLALALLLDYTDDETLALAHYTAFKDNVVSELSCDGPADCWHLTGAEIDAALAEETEEAVIAPDGGQTEPALPSNWQTVERHDRTVYQRRDVDHYIVTSDGTDRRHLLLCSQGDRAYPAPLAVETLPAEANPNPAIVALTAASNDCIAPEEEA